MLTILGAGIGGLTTALALDKNGIPNQIFEATPEIKAVGAGIWMPPNAMQVFDKLGVGEEIRNAGVPLEQIRVVDLNNKLISEINGQWLKQNFGSQTVSIERSVLHHLLASKLKSQQLKLGCNCQKIIESKENVLAEFENSETQEFSYLIAADGLKSVVRKAMGDHRTFRYSGQTCFRGIVQSDPIEELAGGSIEVWGAGARWGLSPISTGKFYWYAAFNASSGQHATNFEALKILSDIYKDFPKFILQLLSKINPESPIQTDLFDLTPGCNWVSNRIALLGDAAHATTPNLGQGAAMAIEDAYVLAQKVKSSKNISEGFIEYNKERKNRVTNIVNTSWQVGQMAKYKNPLLNSIRNSLLRNIPQKISKLQMQEIYNSKIKF